MTSCDSDEYYNILNFNKLDFSDLICKVTNTFLRAIIGGVIFSIKVLIKCDSVFGPDAVKTNEVDYGFNYLFSTNT